MVEAIPPKPHLTLALHRTWTRAASDARAYNLLCGSTPVSAEPLGGPREETAMPTSVPRRKRMARQARLQSARGWLPTYRCRDVVRGYRKWFGVSTLCAIIELRLLGVAVSDERLAQAKTTEDQVARQRAASKRVQTTSEPWPDSDEYFAYIAPHLWPICNSRRRRSTFITPVCTAIAPRRTW